MHRTRTTAISIAVMASLATITFTPAGADETADVRTFAAEGTVADEDLDPSTPLQEGFTLVDATLPDQAAGAEREDGSVPVHVRPDTKYYRYDAMTQSSKPGSYESVILAGTRLKVGGHVTTVAGQRRLTARWIWAPPPPADPKPVNPQPEGVRDFSFQRTFNVVGEVLQTGSRFPTWNGAYGEAFGFVAGNFLSFNNPHIERVAQAHHGKLSFTVTPQTTFYLQTSNGSYRKVSQGEAISLGAPVRVAGKYAWVLDDWQLLVRSVWQPMKETARGAIEWQSAVDRSGDGTVYEGVNLAGDVEVHPGTTELRLDWATDPSGIWSATGTWRAGDLGGAGTIGGPVEGTWDPATGAFEAIAVLEQGTGRHHNLTGSGTVVGQSAPQPSGNVSPPDGLSLSVRLAVERTQAEATSDPEATTESGGSTANDAEPPPETTTTSAATGWSVFMPFGL